MYNKKKRSQTKGKNTYNKKDQKDFKQNKNKSGNNRAQGNGADQSTRGKSGKQYYPQTESPFNDFSWYNQNPELIFGASRVAFPYKPGMSLPFGSDSDVSIPGAMSIQFVPWVGGYKLPTDPINFAAREVFNRVRAAFSGSIDADPPDFIMYFMALDSIFMAIADMKRIYRAINAYTPNNFFLPDGLLEAMGITASQVETWRLSKMQAYQFINTLVEMTRSFICPAIFPVFNRHYWLCDNVYADRNSMNAQMYVFRPKQVLQFSTSDDNQVSGTMAGNLKYIDLDRSSPIGMYASILNLINSLSAWDDAYIISGYLRRAYEGGTAFSVDGIPYDDTLSPLYEESVLSQIENAFTTTTFTEITLNGIFQNLSNNTVYTDYDPKSAATVSTILPHINSRNDAPTMEEITESTRLQSYVIVGNGTSTPIVEIISGTELVVGMNIHTSLGSDPIQIQTVRVVDRSVLTTADWTSIGYLEQFDWHPILYWTISSRQIIFGDVANITSTSYDTIREINRVCLLSEFNAFYR